MAERIDELLKRVEASPEPYLEFLRVPPMSAGIYALQAGSVDRQHPHAQDELYYVVRGRGRFRHLESDRAIATGDILFVGAHEPHQFHSIEEDLVLLVVFGPAESSTG
jgi:mannose-6-phosphate isomerase-like protein (cupin superfamily)